MGEYMSVTVAEPKYKVPETAKLLRKSEKNIWAMIGERRIGVHRVGRSVLIPESEIQRLLDEGYTPARTA
jgi:excisionase family DNA binding protein